jgi:hypothetical protein
MGFFLRRHESMRQVGAVKLRLMDDGGLEIKIT